jgi:cobalt-zinc-cadmium efflux system outer membrane protein
MNMRFMLPTIFVLVSIKGMAQQKPDTLQLSLPAAEKIFLQNNLQLLAQKLNVDAASAQVIQAKLWNNPQLSLAQGAYNPVTKKWFSFDKTNGETAASIQQLILLAGKIRKQVNLAKTNVELAQNNLLDVLRTLRFTLRTDFYSIYYLQQTSLVYNEEIAALKSISAAFEEQNNKGYLARTEVVRIKAQLYSLQSEYNDLINQINDKESELRLILQAKPSVYITPQPDTALLQQQTTSRYPLQTLIDSAYQNNTDLKAATLNVTLNQQNYSYQKALAIPDLSLGAVYDKNGSYVHNSNLLSAGFNIPLFNRNQGNIKSARIMTNFSRTQEQITMKALEEQVSRSFQKALDVEKLYNGIDPSFAGEFAELSTAVKNNYVKRNISILDFLNFYDSYKQNIIQLNNIRLNRVSALENLNLLTGTDLYNK